jgi:hypothetical protein
VLSCFVNEKGESDMSTRKILLIVGLCMLILQGTAYGIIGVDDNVPANELIFPFICEGSIDATLHPAFGNLNTLWTFAETKGLSTTAFFVARNKEGVIVLDYPRLLAPRDVDNGDCQSMINLMPPSGAQKLAMTIGGKDYFVGYLTITNITALEDNLIGWITFSNIPEWAAANFKPYQAEGGADPDTFAEDAGSGPIYADTYFLRYLVLNDLSETSNWWIVLKGKNYCDDKPAGTCTSLSTLDCYICNEQELCGRKQIQVPYRLNIVNVAQIIPFGLFPPLVYPKAGFAYCALEEGGNYLGQNFSYEDFTAFMWSYQRAQNISNIPYPVDPKKLDKLDKKYGIIYDSNVFSLIDPADRLRR